MGMASLEWMEIYRTYSPAELDAEIIALKGQATLYTSQTMGEKSYAKDLVMVQNRLQAAVRVRNERSSRYTNPSYGVPDFSSGVN
jgi:hypothetical protein